jgi:hypothetical protein
LKELKDMRAGWITSKMAKGFQKHESSRETKSMYIRESFLEGSLACSFDSVRVIRNLASFVLSAMNMVSLNCNR